MKLYITIITFLIAAGTTQAQTYMGYMGKCNAVFLNYHLGLSQSPQRLSASNSNLHPVSQIELQIERSIKASKSVGISLRYLNGYFNSATYSNSAIRTLYNREDQMYYGTAPVKDFILGIHQKKFLTKYGGMSPSGRYFQTGINLHLISLGNESELYYTEYTRSDYYQYYLVGEAIKQTNFKNTPYLSVLLAIGNQKIVKFKNSNLVINTAIGSNISLSLLRNITSPTENITPMPTIKNYLSDLDFYYLNLGIGYLF